MAGIPQDILVRGLFTAVLVLDGVWQQNEGTHFGQPCLLVYDSGRLGLIFIVRQDSPAWVPGKPGTNSRGLDRHSLGALRAIPISSHLFQQDLVYHLRPEVTLFLGECRRVSRSFTLFVAPYFSMEQNISNLMCVLTLTYKPHNIIISKVWKIRKFASILLQIYNVLYKLNPLEEWTKGCILPFPKQGNLIIHKNYWCITHTILKFYKTLLLNKI